MPPNSPQGRETPALRTESRHTILGFLKRRGGDSNPSHGEWISTVTRWIRDSVATHRRRSREKRFPPYHGKWTNGWGRVGPHRTLSWGQVRIQMSEGGQVRRTLPSILRALYPVKSTLPPQHDDGFAKDVVDILRYVRVCGECRAVGAPRQSIRRGPSTTWRLARNQGGFVYEAVDTDVCFARLGRARISRGRRMRRAAR